MITIRLKDTSTRCYEVPITGLQLAHDIGPKLKEASLAMTLDGKLCDITSSIEADADVTIITSKDPEGIEVIRHDAAHVLAQAIKELYPTTQITIGPVIHEGFFYDILPENPLSAEDLPLIEARMHEIVARDEIIHREIWEKDKAIALFQSMGEHYKVEIINDLSDGEIITLYRHGNFVDLCRGPHAPSTGKLGKGFKLLKLAGAYWRGNSKNAMLQRIYGTAWPDVKQLNAYLTRIEEAEKRDHRKLGKALDLFHLQEEGPGQIFWHPKGFALYHAVEQYIRKKQIEYNYAEIKTPALLSRTLWEQSGHWEKFQENMFTLEADKHVFALKPMNCPGHVQVFKQKTRSYRDLPLRFSEFGSCHRNEPSGALHGLMRCWVFTQDDAHIFCSETQITSETIIFCEMVRKIYQDFGFLTVKVKFSDRPVVRAGSDETWDKAESSLKEAVEAAGLEYSLNPQEGAFYGPKLEFVLSDAIGREWQCATLQVDFVLPERLSAFYIGEDGKKHHPVMLHRAALGSMERFIGVLIEEYAGSFPLWLAPIQGVIATIVSGAEDYAKEVHALFHKKNIRIELDCRNEKISYKIREHILQKIPLILVIGEKEVETRSITLRKKESSTQETLALEEAMRKIEEMCRFPL